MDGEVCTIVMLVAIVEMVIVVMVIVVNLWRGDVVIVRCCTRVDVSRVRVRHKDVAQAIYVVKRDFVDIDNISVSNEAALGVSAHHDLSGAHCCAL